MITVSEFAKAGPRLTAESTVIKWLKQGYIVGAVQEDGEWLIPDDARKPYTQNNIRKNSTCDAIVTSILKGLNEKYAVFPELYRKTSGDCQCIFNQLEECGYIEIVTLSCEVQYYNITLKGIDYLKKSKSEKMQIVKEMIVTGGKFADAIKAGLILAEKLMPA